VGVYDKERFTWAICEMQSPSGGKRLPAVGRKRLQGDFQSSGQSRTIRTLLSLAAVEDLEIHQVGVKTAFLHGEVLEDIYIYAPEGAGYQKGTILKLRKSLYGIRQAPRVFYQLIREHLIIHGFLNIKSNTCIFTKVVNGNRIYIAVYVDDMLLFAKLLIARSKKF
jgi:hypothetical protein